MRVIIGLACLLTCFWIEVQAQVRPQYSQYIFNPYLINPAFISAESNLQLHLNHRRQWIGIADAPVVSTFTIQKGFDSGLGIGSKVYTYKRGLLNTTAVYLSSGYKVKLGYRHDLQMAFSGTVIKNSLDYQQVENTNDPVVMNGIDSRWQFNGQFGINYHLYGLNLGMTLNDLLSKNNLVSGNEVAQEIDPFGHITLQADYRIPFAQGQVALQPYLLYHQIKNLKTQWEAGSIVYLYDRVQLGASYRQDYGPTGLFGLNLSKSLSLGYAYEFATAQVSGFGQGSHEIQLSLKLGKKKIREEEINESNVIQEEKSLSKQNLDSTSNDQDSSENSAPQSPELKEISTVPPPVQTKLKKTDDEGSTVSDSPAVTSSSEPEAIEQAVSDSKPPMKPGFYLVIGTFQFEKNAKGLLEQEISLQRQAFMDYHPVKALYYVYLKYSPTEKPTSEELKKVKDTTSYRDAWIMEIPLP